MDILPNACYYALQKRSEYNNKNRKVLMELYGNASSWLYWASSHWFECKFYDGQTNKLWKNQYVECGIYEDGRNWPKRARKDIKHTHKRKPPIGRAPPPPARARAIIIIIGVGIDCGTRTVLRTDINNSMAVFFFFLLRSFSQRTLREHRPLTIGQVTLVIGKESQWTNNRIQRKYWGIGLNKFSLEEFWTELNRWW